MANMTGSVQGYANLCVTMGDAILLLRKQTPEWQLGKLNFPGGKIEAGETPLEAAEREAEEELGLNLAREIRVWRYVGVEFGPGYAVHLFAGTLDPAMVSLTPDKNDVGEVFEWQPVGSMPRDVIGNLRWMVPLALDPRADVRFEVTAAGDITRQSTWSPSGGRGVLG